MCNTPYNRNKKVYFHSVFEIFTSNKVQDEVSKEVTTKTLETLKDLLMERIGFIPRTEQIDNIIRKNKIVRYEDLIPFLPPLEFDLRETVESNSDFIQPLPIAVITNKGRTKLLVIKKNKSAVSETSTEKDKHLIYVGGHSRYEDKTASNSMDFVSICKTALKREIKEEIGISVALSRSLCCNYCCAIGFCRNNTGVSANSCYRSVTTCPNNRAICTASTYCRTDRGCFAFG